jgi:hypothetical protein
MWSEAVRDYSGNGSNGALPERFIPVQSAI